jgi:O-antigen/teichoic acid export membrane protein
MISLQSLQKHSRYLLNLGSTFGSQAVTAISILVLTPLLVQRLGEGAYSTYGVLLNLILVASIFDFGLNTGLVHRLIQEPAQRNSLLNAVFFFYFLIVLLAAPIIYILFSMGWVVASEHQAILAILLAGLVVQNMLSSFVDAIFQSINKVYLSKWVRIGRTLLEAGLLYVVSAKGSVSLLLTTSFIVNILFILVLLRVASQEVSFKFHWKFFTWRVLWSQLRYSFWYFQSMLATVIAYNIQILLLQHYLSAAQLTIFLLVFRFFEVFRTGLTNFTAVLFPSISAMQAAENWSGLREQFRAVFVRVLGLSLLAFGIIGWKGDVLFSWWSHYNTAESTAVFKVYALYVFLLVIDHVSVVFLAALKYNRAPSIVSTIQSTASLFLTGFLIAQWGLSGAVWASLLAFATTSLIFNPAYLLYRLRKEV